MQGDTKIFFLAKLTFYPSKRAWEKRRLLSSLLFSAILRDLLEIKKKKKKTFFVLLLKFVYFWTNNKWRFFRQLKTTTQVSDCLGNVIYTTINKISGQKVEILRVFYTIFTFSRISVTLCILCSFSSVRKPVGLVVAPPHSLNCSSHQFIMKAYEVSVTYRFQMG